MKSREQIRTEFYERVALAGDPLTTAFVTREVRSAITPRSRVREMHFGSVYTDRIDATGYTRFVYEPSDGRFEADVEWVALDHPLPAATPRPASGTPWRFFDRSTGIP